MESSLQCFGKLLNICISATKHQSFCSQMISGLFTFTCVLLFAQAQHRRSMLQTQIHSSKLQASQNRFYWSQPLLPVSSLPYKISYINSVPTLHLKVSLAKVILFLLL